MPKPKKETQLLIKGFDPELRPVPSMGVFFMPIRHRLNRAERAIYRRVKAERRERRRREAQEAKKAKKIAS